MTAADATVPVQNTGRGIAGVLRERYRTELGLLHRSLFSDSGRIGYGAGRGQLPPAVAGWAVSERSVRVSVAASVGDLGEAVAAGTLSGSVAAGTVEVHVSVRGRHRVTGRAVGLVLAEEEGWARAVFGPRWEDGAFYAGHGTGTGEVVVAHFSLFLDPDRTPVSVPAGWGSPQLQPLTGPLERMPAW